MVSENKKYLLFIIVLLIIGGFLRIYFLGDQSLWIDESYSITAATGIIEKGLPYMPSGDIYSRAILNTSFIALSMKIFGISAFFARLPSVFFGILTILVSFLLFSKLYNKKIGLAVSFILTFSLVEIAWSRQARMYQQLQFFYLLSIYLFYKYSKTSEWKTGIFTIVSIICAILSHQLGLSLFIVLPFYALLSNLSYLKNPSKIKKIKTRNLFLILFFCLGLVFSQLYFRAFTQVLSVRMNYLLAYLYYFKNFLPFVFYFSIPGIFLSLKEDWKKSLLPLLSLLPLYFVLFHEKLLGYRYAFFLLPFFFLFFVKTFEHFSKYFNNKILRNLVIILPILLLFTTSLSLVPQKSYYLEPRAPQPKFSSVYSYLSEHRQPSDTLIVSYPEISLWYDQNPDYWLAFSISGFSPSRWMNKEQTHYKRTMTPAISNIQELESVYQNKTSGWIVVDSLAASRLSSPYFNFLKNKTTWLPGPSKPGTAGGINLYHWNKSS